MAEGRQRLFLPVFPAHPAFRLLAGMSQREERLMGLALLRIGWKADADYRDALALPVPPQPSRHPGTKQIQVNVGIGDPLLTLTRLDRPRRRAEVWRLFWLGSELFFHGLRAPAIDQRDGIELPRPEGRDNKAMAIPRGDPITARAMEFDVRDEGASFDADGMLFEFL